MSTEPRTEPTHRRTGLNLNLRFSLTVLDSNRGSGPNFGIPPTDMADVCVEGINSSQRHHHARERQVFFHFWVHCGVK